MKINRKSFIIGIIFSTFTLLVVIYFATKQSYRSSVPYNSEMEVDSLLNLSFDMEEMIESIFLNQGYKLPKNIVFRKASNTTDTITLGRKTIFAYMSPLACWSCVKTINKHLSSIPYTYDLVYLIPENLSVEIQTFLDYTGIPISQVYYLSSNLGLPIEETNRVFLFTLEDKNIIHNVFPPSKYSQEITETYINSIVTNN